MRNKLLLVGAAVAAIALPAIAQQVAQPAAPAQTQPTAPATAPTPGPGAEPVQSAPATSARTGTPDSGPGETETGVADASELNLAPPTPPVEIPEHARRNPSVTGRLDPVELGLGAAPWGGANGAFLSGLLRRMDAPLSSRWLHIALRNALLARVRAPRSVHPVDWSAERSWMLLRMGEADAARMLVADVDVDRFTPKMYQVGVQSALATADPPALCPLQDGIRKYEKGIAALVDAMCASLSGEPESAAAQIDAARRRGRIGGIDLVLPQKVVGAGANTSRAVTVEWDPVDSLNSWRFGLATATGIAPPERLINAATPQVRAWQARAPLLSAQQRLASARIATGLGVFSSQALLDLYSAIYDATDPDELSGTDAWQLRLAFAGKDLDARLSAMRKLWKGDKDSLDREASRALLGRAASLVAPDADLENDAANLIASMLAAGYDRQAARWASVLGGMEAKNSDACWAMLALAAPDGVRIDTGSSRVDAFIGRDDSNGKQRSALLVAGLAALGRLSSDDADKLNRRYGLGLEHRTRWTQMIDGAAGRGQAGTVLVLAGTGFQALGLQQLPSSHLFHAVAGLRRTGQDFTARMIAAEALSRT
ncbi:MAG: hypothetical protein ABIQ32_10920 [Sphingomicrobium sp.]